MSSRTVSITAFAALGVCLAGVADGAERDRRLLTLKEALALADSNLPALRQAAADTAVLSAQADEARAPLLPQLNTTGSYQRTTANFVPQPSITPGVGTHPRPTNTTYNFWRFGATFTQALFDAPSFAYWRSALASIGAQRATWDTARLDAAYNVRLAYFGARANAALVEVARETLENQKRHLGQVQGYVDVGSRPEIDLAQSRADMANAQVQLITAQNNYDTSKATLNQAMGVAMDTDYEVEDVAADPVDLEDSPIEADVEAAEKARPELRAFDERVHQEMLLRRRAQWGWSPVLGFTANVSDAGAALDNLGWNYYVQLGATWNLFGGLLNWSQAREANAQIASISAQRDTERLQVRLELEKGRLAVRAAKSAIAAANDAYENAKILARLAEGRYKAGVGNAIELSDAILQQATAQGQLVQSRFNLATARAQFLRALGRR